MNKKSLTALCWGAIIRLYNQYCTMGQVSDLVVLTGGEAVRRNNRIRWLSLVLAGLLFLAGCVGTGPGGEDPQVQSFGGLVCMEYSRYSGPFPEDGSGRNVENVAAMRVHNSSDKFLDYAVIRAWVGSQQGTFRVTGLPPGGTVWVLEQEGLTLTPGERFVATDCEDYFFREDAVYSSDKLSVETEGNSLTVTNRSDVTLKNVCTYYKTVHGDGNYFGGISYLLEFGELAPGQTVTRRSSHFGPDSRIVRLSFQESG